MLNLKESSDSNATYIEEKNLLFLSLSSITFINLFLNFKILNLLFLISIFLFFNLGNLRFKYLFFSIFFSSLILFFNLLISFKTNKTYFVLLNNFFNVHQYLTEFVEKTFTKDISEFINSFLFSKSKYDSNIYKNFQELGISHLLTISGFHFFILEKFFDFLFGKKFIFKYFFTIPLFLLLWSGNNYSISTTRALFSILIVERNKLKKWSYLSLISVFFNFEIYLKLSFWLSYIISLILIIFERLNIDKIKKFILKNICIYLYFFGLLFSFFKKIPFLIYFNFIIFSPIISFLFFYFLFAALFKAPEFLNIFIYENFQKIIEFFGINKVSWEFSSELKDFSVLLIFILSIIFIFVYFYREEKYSLIFSKIKNNILK